MKLRDICNKLEEWAPLAYQESYDNGGLIVGDPETDGTPADNFFCYVISNRY